eukprot:scaffold5269_cov255-Prasinococcus_capsulatus_cf.AAC.1
MALRPGVGGAARAWRGGGRGHWQGEASEDVCLLSRGKFARGPPTRRICTLIHTHSLPQEDLRGGRGATRCAYAGDRREAGWMSVARVIALGHGSRRAAPRRAAHLAA